MVQNEATDVALLGPQGELDVTITASHYVLRVMKQNLRVILPLKNGSH